MRIEEHPTVQDDQKGKSDFKTGRFGCDGCGGGGWKDARVLRRVLSRL